MSALVVALHLAFILFAVLGGLLTFRWRWMPWVHLPAVAWAAFVEVTGRICPLTLLENSVRRARGVAGYEGDFIEQYLLPIVYPAGLTREIQLALALLLVAANVAIYTALWRSRTRLAQEVRPRQP